MRILFGFTSRLWSVLLAFAFILVVYPAQSKEKNTLVPSWKYAESKLKKAGFDKEFIRQLKKSYNKKEFHQVVELNLLLYLKKSDYHGVQVTNEATKAIRSFLKSHKKTLSEAERKYGVPGPYIASLLWMESRHGQNQGTFHVPSVFVHLLQADQAEIIKKLQKIATKYGDVDDRVRREIEERTKKKGEWAISELKAIQKMFHANKHLIKNWRGSFSGAFGLPQFLPSSYTHYAMTLRNGGIADLTRPEDSIVSVAYYLHMNGWKKRNPETHEKALMRYNNSRDYAQAIIKMSQESRSPAQSK